MVMPRAIQISSLESSASIFMLLALSPIPAFIRAMPALAVAVDEKFAADRALPALMAAIELPLSVGHRSNVFQLICPLR
jgi:hypothetical protein